MRFLKAIFVFIICQQLLQVDGFAQNNDTIIKGFVHDIRTQGRLINLGSVYITGDDSTHFKIPVDKNGNYAVLRSQIKEGINYLVTAGDIDSCGYTGYYFKTMPFSLPVNYTGTPYELNFELEIKWACELPIPDFYFEINSSELDPPDKVAGDKYVEVLNDNPAVTILIRGHADATEKNRFKLSEKRAKAVMKYLTDEGADKARIQFTGVGDLANRKLEYDINFFKEGDVLTPEYISNLTDPGQKKEAIRMNTYTQIVIISTHYGEGE